MNILIVLIGLAVFLIFTTPYLRKATMKHKQFDPGKFPAPKTVPPESVDTKDEGIELGSGVSWSPESHPNPHILIIGGSGSGKSWAIRYLAANLSERGYPSILFDFHGDLGIEGCSTFPITLDSQFGVNPLILSHDPTGGGPDPQRFEVLDQLRNTFKPMGSLQIALVDEYLKAIYRDAGILQDDPSSWRNPAPHFGHLEQEIERMVIEDPKDLRAKGLKTKLSLAFDFRIFSKPQVPLLRPSEDDGSDSLRKSAGSVIHLDLSKLPPQLQYLASDTLLKQIFREHQLAGVCPLSIYLLIDESKLCTPIKKDSPLAALNRIATEGRKFGLGLIVSSQFVGHLPRDVVVNTFTKILMKTDKTEITATARRFKVDESLLICLKEPGNAVVNFAESSLWKELRLGSKSSK